MKTSLLHLIPAFVFFLPVHADWLLQGGGFYTSATDTNNGASSTTTRLPLDAHLYYLNQSWAFGATYDTENLTTNTGGESLTTTRTALGPSVGWPARKEIGFYVLATYFISAKVATPGVTYTGSGLQAEVGYRLMFRHFGLGLQGTYRSFDLKDSGNAQVKLKQTRIDPGLFLIFEL